VRRFLSIFYPPAVYQKLNVEVKAGEEHFFTSAKVLVEEGFLPVSQYSFTKKKENAEEENDTVTNADELREIMGKIKKGTQVSLRECTVKEGETSPPKRYNSGSIILAMENAGQLIEEEELRAQIKGSGIGTSATRAEILKKLFNIHYLNLNKKTQIITPTLKGELVCGIVRYSMPQMLSPKLTASWEKGLTGVAAGEISEEEYMKKLTDFVSQLVNRVKGEDNRGRLNSYYRMASENYKRTKKQTKKQIKK
jgi:DNA topoisomerase-3